MGRKESNQTNKQIMSSQEDNEQFLDIVASPLYSVSITTLRGEGITNTGN